jgi:hypothetical protein
MYATPGHFLTARKPGADQQFVAVTQHVGLAHHPVYVDLRKVGYPLRQRVAPLGRLVSAPEP